MSRHRLVPILLLLSVLASLEAQEPTKDKEKEKEKAKESPPSAKVVIVDAGGKEITPKNWKLVLAQSNIRKLNWVDGKPDAFAIREFGSTNYVDGIVTLVPMSRLNGIRYDYETTTATFDIAGLEKPLEGSCKFSNTNMITLEAEVEQGNSGLAAVRYKGGSLKGGFKSIKFEGAKAPDKPAPLGDLFSFLVANEAKGKPPTVQTANGVQPLYRFADGTEKTLPYLMFKKTLKIELANIKSIHVGDSNVKEHTIDCDVVTKDGMTLSLVMMTAIEVEGKRATLLGFLGNVPAGYRLFPIHTFMDFQPGEMKVPEEKKEEPKKKEPPKKGTPKNPKES